MYIQRGIEETLRRAARQAKIVLLTGPRQIGKTTTMREVFKDHTCIYHAGR